MNQKTCEFNEAGVFFPSRDAGFYAEREINPEDIVGPVTIRIKSSNVGAIPRFDVGEVGTFRGEYRGIIYVATNAKVMESKPGDLQLEAKSLDGATNPVSFTRE